MRPEYDFSKGERSRYTARYAAGANVILLSTEIAEFFPDSDAVNEALHSPIKIARNKPSTRGTKSKPA